MNNITVFITRFLVHFSLFFSCIIFLCRVFTPKFYGFKYLYLFCFTLPLQLSSAAHLYVSNRQSPYINFWLSTADASVPHALLSASTIQPSLFNQQAISCIPHDHSCITVHSHSPFLCSSCLLLTYVQTTHYQPQGFFNIHVLQFVMS